MTTKYLIVGNGAAGATAAEEIRARDVHGDITIVSAEPHPMYSRPGLAYIIINEIPPHQVIARKPEWYAKHKIKMVHGKAVKLDVSARRLHLEHQHVLPYDRLLIATGARATPLPYPGGALDGVVYLDTLDGTKDLIKKMKRAKRAVVVGGGITALEMTEGFVHNKVETHYLVRKDTLWSAVFNAAESKLLDHHMREHGVLIHYNTEVAEVLGDKKQRVTGVKFTSGETQACEVVGAGIGVKSELDWLKDSSLKTERGILVDEHLETNVPGVFAAGDCAQAWDRWTKKHMLDVLWPTAVAQGRVAGANLTGAREAYAKGTPFNACLLFGLHITAMGQLGGGREDDSQIVQHTISRGSSELWSTRPHSYASAWTQTGDNSLRLVLDGNRITGALVIGEQSLADPLRELIERQADIAPVRPALDANAPDLPEQLRAFWQALPKQEAKP